MRNGYETFWQAANQRPAVIKKLKKGDVFKKKTVASPAKGKKRQVRVRARWPMLRPRELPVYKVRKQILNQLHGTRVLVITGETGSGKSTRE